MNAKREEEESLRVTARYIPTHDPAYHCVSSGDFRVLFGKPDLASTPSMRLPEATMEPIQRGPPIDVEEVVKNEVKYVVLYCGDFNDWLLIQRRHQGISLP